MVLTRFLHCIASVGGEMVAVTSAVSVCDKIWSAVRCPRRTRCFAYGTLLNSLFDTMG